MKITHLILPLLTAVALLLGCSDPKEPNACAEKTCPQACKAGQCVDFECSDADTSKCQPHEICNGGVCAPTTSAGCTMNCTRGVCDKTNNRCVNDEICSPQSETTRCLEGHICLNQRCIPEKDLCQELNCEKTRGVCDATTRTCINQTPCQDSYRCLENYYCDKSSGTGVCTVNSCRADGSCAKGVCNITTGTCENAPDGTCITSEMCKDGFECVEKGTPSSPNSVCLPKSDLCGNCFGKRTCTYDGSPGKLTAVCEETTCDSAYDCNDGKICDVATKNCITPAACPASEANTSYNFNTDAISHKISNLQLCNGNTDTFTYKPPKRDLLLVKLTRKEGEGSFGRLILRATGPGVPTQEVILGEGGDDELLIKSFGPPTNSEAWTFTVSADGIDASVATYSLQITPLDANASTLCDNATPLIFGKVFAGSNRDSTGTALAPSCGDFNLGQTPKQVWSFSIDEPQAYVSFEARPDSHLDVALSIRKVCEDDHSEILCVNSPYYNEIEKISAVLPKGDYYLVSSFSNHTDSIYTLKSKKEAAVCMPGSYKGECITELHKHAEMICNEKGQWEENICQSSLGCDTATGKCLPNEGDACLTAVHVTEDKKYNSVINTKLLTNRYEGKVCNHDTDKTIAENRTAGNDFVIRATVPNDKTVFASATFLDPTLSSPSIYIVEDCSDIQTCLNSGYSDYVHEGAYTHYHNTTGAEKDVFVIIDLPDGVSAEKLLEIDVFVDKKICEPSKFECVKSNTYSVRCNPLGSAYEVEQKCTRGCETDASQKNHGQCKTPIGDICTNPIILNTANQYSSTISLKNQYSHTSAVPGTQCGSIEGRDGRNHEDYYDAFFAVETTLENQVITISAVPEATSGFNPMIWAYRVV